MTTVSEVLESRAVGKRFQRGDAVERQRNNLERTITSQDIFMQKNEMPTFTFVSALIAETSSMFFAHLHNNMSAPWADGEESGSRQVQIFDILQAASFCAL
jgi:hypothetical protein